MPIQGGAGILELNRKIGRFWDLTDQGICFISLISPRSHIPALASIASIRNG